MIQDIPIAGGSPIPPPIGSPNHNTLSQIEEQFLIDYTQNLLKQKQLKDTLKKLQFDAIDLLQVYQKKGVSTKVMLTAIKELQKETKEKTKEKHCKDCKVLLTEDNCYKSVYKRSNARCKSCFKKI
jgi:uncharacterized paraquat-inducible protein A